MQLNELKKLSDKFDPSPLMPVLFIGHGNPMNALWDNPFTRSLRELSKSIQPRPQAILVVSAHWLTRGTQVMNSPRPRTIHDFGGFPEALYQEQYPAPGAPELARITRGLVRSADIAENDQWGLDHGAWTVLKFLYPEAEIPVYQLSIDYYSPARYHFDLAGELRPLRERGVLVLGSGNIVHNLRQADFQNPDSAYPWAQEFDAWVKGRLDSGNWADLLNLESQGTSGRLAVPTPDHYFPLMYSLGLSSPEEGLIYSFEGIQQGSISMRCLRIGA